MIKYDLSLINNILLKYLENAKIEDFEFIKKLNSIILNTKELQYGGKCIEKINLADTIQLAYKFLYSIDSKYANYLVKRINDGTMEFSQKFESGYSGYDFQNDKRVIGIPVTNTIDDGFVIIHEIIHDYNLDFNNLTETRHLFTEFLSICVELLFSDFLQKDNLFLDDKTSRVNNIFLFIKRISYKTDFEIRLMSHFLDYGYVDKDVIENIIPDNNETYMWQVNYSLSDACKFKTMSLDFSQRYVIGGLFSSYLYERILNNPNNIEEFKELNEIINCVSCEDFVNYLGLEVEDCKSFILTDESVKKLEKSYNNELKRF